MRRSPALLCISALLLATLAWSGCATAEKMGRAALAQTPKGRQLLWKWDRYARLAKVFKKYHDRGTLNDKDVMSILYGAGVLKKLPPGVKVARKKGKKGRRARKPKPFPVPRYKGKWRWPLDAGIVSSEFGPRWGKNHKGMDLAAKRGVPVYAMAAGKVLYAGDRLRGYGNVVILRHDEKTTSLYAHNDAIKVKEFSQVKRGQVIALLGSTGRSTGPHVHFEIRGSKGAVNPRKILPKSRF